MKAFLLSRFLWHGNPHWWMKSSPHWLYLTFVIFIFFSFRVFIWDAGGCWHSLSVCGLCVQNGLRKCVTLFNSGEKVGKRWLTSSKISNDVDGKPCSRWPRGKRSHVECFQWSACVKKRSWVLIQMKDPLHIIFYFIAFLYCILLLTGFTVRKLYYVSILCYYASVFDFPKYKKLYIALCYGRKYFLPRSIKISLWNWCDLIFPLVWYSCGSEKPINNLQMPTTNFA